MRGFVLISSAQFTLHPYLQQLAKTFIADDKNNLFLMDLKKYSKVTITANDFRGTPKYKSFSLIGFSDRTAKLECLK